MNKLEKIIDYKKQELEHLKRKVSLKDVRLKAEDAEPARDFFKSLKGEGETKIIAEIKKASPSAGIIRADFDPVKIAQIYEENGTAAISVLTDEHFFQGKLEYLDQIKRVVKLPLLRKDFTFDAYQIYEARGAGADAVLLIVRVLEKSQLKDYQALAEELGMSVLVEVHDEEELKKAEEIDAKLIGINNRNLETFETDIETTVKLAVKCRGGVTPPLIISESGIATRDDILKLKGVGVNVFLIGETLMREGDLGGRLRELVGL